MNISDVLHSNFIYVETNERMQHTSGHKVVFNLWRLADAGSQIGSERLRATEKLLNTYNI